MSNSSCVKRGWLPFASTRVLEATVVDRPVSALFRALVAERGLEGVLEPAEVRGGGEMPSFFGTNGESRVLEAEAVHAILGRHRVASGSAYFAVILTEPSCVPLRPM